GPLAALRCRVVVGIRGGAVVVASKRGRLADRRRRGHDSRGFVAVASGRTFSVGGGGDDRVDQTRLPQFLGALDAQGLGDLLQLRQELALESASFDRCVHQVDASPSSWCWSFSQSAWNRSMPISVSGCFTSFVKTSNGIVAMSAPACADSTTCIGCRSDAARTLVS